MHIFKDKLHYAISVILEFLITFSFGFFKSNLKTNLESCSVLTRFKKKYIKKFKGSNK